MENLVMLTEEIPFVMAPAALIALMILVSVVIIVVRFSGPAFKLMMLYVMLGLSIGVLMMVKSVI